MNTSPMPRIDLTRQASERPNLDMASYDDITRAIKDGGLDRIIDEHLRYMKEAG